MVRSDVLDGLIVIVIVRTLGTVRYEILGCFVTTRMSLRQALVNPYIWFISDSKFWSCIIVRWSRYKNRHV